MSRPRLFDFIRTDFISLLLSLFAPVSLAFATWAAFKLPVFETGRVLNGQTFERMTPQQALIFLGIAVLSALLAAVVVTLRLRAARSAFRGVFAPGRITKIAPFKDRAYLHFHYTYGSNDFDTWRLVHQTREFKGLQVGQAVEVAIEPTRPHSAWVVELFP